MGYSRQAVSHFRRVTGESAKDDSKFSKTANDSGKLTTMCEKFDQSQAFILEQNFLALFGRYVRITHCVLCIVRITQVCLRRLKKFNLKWGIRLAL